MSGHRCAIVTGGSRGIGRGIVLALAEAGYDIAFSYNTGAEEAKVVADIVEGQYLRRVFYTQAKLDAPGVGKQFFDRAVDYLGSLDLFVNNAGVTIFENVAEITEEALDFMIALDFRNYVMMMREASRYMIVHKRKGAIINITSTRAERAYPGDGIYGGLKAGLNRAIESFALDVAKYGIRINNVAPGAIQVRKKEEIKEAYNGRLADTFWDDLGKRIPIGRSGTPDDIAKAVVFLASAEASYITGTTLRVDGGLILPGMPEDKNDVGWN